MLVKRRYKTVIVRDNKDFYGRCSNIFHPLHIPLYDQKSHDVPQKRKILSLAHKNTKRATAPEIKREPNRPLSPSFKAELCDRFSDVPSFSPAVLQLLSAIKCSPVPRPIRHANIRLKALRRYSLLALRIPRTVLRWELQWVPVTEPHRNRPMWPDIAGTRNTRLALDRDEARRMSSRLCRRVPQDRRTVELVDDRTTVPIRVGLVTRLWACNSRWN